MWHLATYQPVSLFSLRPANATTAGGKTLITPTPYAVKMALLNAAFRLYGLAAAAHFPRLRDLEVAVWLPEAVLVIGTFQRILRPKKLENPLGTGLDAVWQSNIAFREYVHFAGLISLAVREPKPAVESLPWANLFSQINYFGKRGSFFQFLQYETLTELNDQFTWLNPDQPGAIPLNGLLQLMDDCGPDMTYAHANIYDQTTLRVGQPNGRLLKTVVLPYQMESTARGFTLYRRLTT